MRSLRTAAAPITPRLLGAGALLGAALLGACNTANDAFVGAPVAIQVTGGEGLNAEVASVLGPFVVKVVDTAGTGVSGIPITFTISGPATLITTTATTNQDGSALTSITLAHTVGAVTITATATGIATPAVIHASSFAGAATKFFIAGGQGQTAVHGTPLLEDLAVGVTDQYDNPLMNVLVSWLPSAGAVGATTSRTLINGRASTTFTPVVGPQTVQAITTLEGGVQSTVTFNLSGS